MTDLVNRDPECVDILKDMIPANGISPESLPAASDEIAIQFPNGARITRRQLLFVQRYFELDFDEQRAVLAAGYKTEKPQQRANELMQNPYIAQMILQRMREIQKSVDVTKEEVIEMLVKEARREDDGAQHSARVSALSTLARIFGAFEKGGDKKRNLVIINYENLEDETATDPRVASDSDAAGKDPQLPDAGQ